MSCATKSSATDRARGDSRAGTDRKRGSVLIVTIVLTTGLALALGSFVAVAMQALKLSNRSFLANSALNLAEAGLEKAMLAINHDDWSGWTVAGSSRKLTYSGLEVGDGYTEVVNVLVSGLGTSTTPRIVAEGRINSPLGPAVTKQVEVMLQRRSHWATGIVSKDTITFSGGNATVDSYVSDDPAFSTDGLYDPAKRRDHGSAASILVTTDAISISNSDIWGFVATGGSPPNAGPNGTIRGEDTPKGVKIDTNRISTDFTASFDPVLVPTEFDQVWNEIKGNVTLGADGTSVSILAASMSNSNGKTIEIRGHVTLVVRNSVDIKGTLVVRPDASLEIYVDGDFEAGGNGAVNESGLPQNLIIYGTADEPGSQTIKLHGNGVLHAAIYAPNAALELKGGGNSGEMCGSAVAHSVRITGNYAFHYDEALQKLGAGNPFGVSRWRELVSRADRVSF